MKASIKFLIIPAAMSLLLASPLLHTTAYGASADPVDIDPDLAAKVAREKLKQRQAQQSGDAKKTKSECGKVDIGNTDNSKSADKVNSKEKTVIITGPVINAAKC